MTKTEKKPCEECNGIGKMCVGHSLEHEEFSDCDKCGGKGFIEPACQHHWTYPYAVHGDNTTVRLCMVCKKKERVKFDRVVERGRGNNAY